jgi:hypothetical protein
MNQEKAFMGLQVRFRRLCALVLAFACLAVVGGQQAHAAKSDDADLRELSRYQLTMADFNKYAAASEKLAKLPKVEEEANDTDEDEDADDGSESLDGITARIEKVPAARQAIVSAGLTVRQYAVITMALFQASFAQFAIDQGADPAKVARDAGVNPANLRFVKEHKAELEKLKKPSED